MHNDQVVGKCSICGGDVVLPFFYLSVKPPVPRCVICGAVAKQDNRQVIPMEPPKEYRGVDYRPRLVDQASPYYGKLDKSE